MCIHTLVHIINDYQAGSVDVALVLEVGEEGDRLEGLSQPHFVGQDAVDPVFVRCRTKGRRGSWDYVVSSRCHPCTG